MDQSRLAAVLLQIEHRHEDGTWGSLERRRAHHDVSDHDPERDWVDGELYACTTCDEQIRVRAPEGGPSEPR